MRQFSCKTSFRTRMMNRSLIRGLLFSSSSWYKVTNCAPQTQSSNVIHQLQIISAFVWDLIGGTERSLPSLYHVMPQTHLFLVTTLTGNLLPDHQPIGVTTAPVLVCACEFGHLFTFIYLSGVALMHCWLQRACKGICQVWKRRILSPPGFLYCIDWPSFSIRRKLV